MQSLLLGLLLELLKKLITPELIKSFEQQAVCWALGQVANTDNKIDDTFVDILAEALGVDKSQCGK